MCVIVVNIPPGVQLERFWTLPLVFLFGFEFTETRKREKIIFKVIDYRMTWM